MLSARLPASIGLRAWGRSPEDQGMETRVWDAFLTDQDKADVVAFLESLTDQEFLTDPRFGDPFASEPDDVNRVSP